jgi:anti-sigma factor ChrR (cupin superfamily)
MLAAEVTFNGGTGLLNNDLSVGAVVHAARLDWVASPTPGVDRRMLFRIGDEKARATSIVRYAPGSRFPHHDHPGGEEFFVAAPAGWLSPECKGGPGWRQDLAQSRSTAPGQCRAVLNFEASERRT